MNIATISNASSPRLTAPIAALPGLLDRIPVWIPQIIFRLAVALVFWRSGQTKLDSWSTTILLFENEYNLPILPPDLAAYMAVGLETAGPILLVLGLGTRLTAAAMLGMTMVIQLFVFPQSYVDHLLWAGPLVYLLIRGPGLVSLDHAIRRRFMA